MSGVPLLQGYALRLRPPNGPDLPQLFDWYNDPENVAPFDRFSLDTFASFESAVWAAPDDPRSLAPRFVIELVDGARVLGFVGHYRPHPVLETTDIWYVIGEQSERGKGHGKEAVGLLVDYLFHEANLARVGAAVDVANVPSYRLLEGLKFRREGTLRSALYHHATWHDVLVYGVTRAEWSEAPRSLSPIPTPAA